MSAGCSAAHVPFCPETMAKSCFSPSSGPCPNTNPVGRFALILLTQRQSLSPLLDEPAVHQGDFAHVLHDREEGNRLSWAARGPPWDQVTPPHQCGTCPIHGDTSPRAGEETPAGDAQYTNLHKLHHDHEGFLRVWPVELLPGLHDLGIAGGQVDGGRAVLVVLPEGRQLGWQRK